MKNAKVLLCNIQRSYQTQKSLRLSYKNKKGLKMKEKKEGIITGKINPNTSIFLLLTPYKQKTQTKRKYKEGSRPVSKIQSKSNKIKV